MQPRSIWVTDIDILSPRHSGFLYIYGLTSCFVHLKDPDHAAAEDPLSSRYLYRSLVGSGLGLAPTDALYRRQRAVIAKAMFNDVAPDSAERK
jgi:hypothetical protein